jgi:hypothetical protein
MTETGKEIPFNSGKLPTPRLSRNCTAANNKAWVISYIYQQFVRGKISYSEELKFCNLYIQFQIFILHFTFDINVLNILIIYSWKICK